MTYPDPRVTDDSGVPEVAQEFDALVAEHRARLEADRVANVPVTPAEERTGVSDVQHAVLDELRKLDSYITDYGNARAATVSAGSDADSKAAFQKANGLNEAISNSIARIEQWTRGQS